MRQSDVESLPTDELLTLVADRCRRQALHSLQARDDVPVTVGELAADVATDSTLSESEIALALHHIHLPKLAAAGVVDHDARTRTVRYHSSDALEELLGFVSETLE